MTTSMASTRLMSDLDFTLAQLAFFGVIVLLTVDAINPVKMFLHVFPSVSAWQVAAVAILLMIYVFISELKALLFFGVKVFFHSILSIFFREVQVVGRHNIPTYGPVIFTTNHANQFIDAVMVLPTCERKISYLIAEKSWNRPIVGDVAWAMDAVPVKRAQDAAVKGTGTISVTFMKTDVDTTIVQVNGTDTLFLSEIKVGDKIRPPGTATQLKIVSIESDTAMHIDAANVGDEALPEGSVPFDILPHVDQKIVYEKVLDKLASGGAIGIFPEGGSHDRTDLLPLKVGIALIAYEALAKDGINIPIVPVGLNYFSRHRFRGGVVVEYGPPMYIDRSTLQDFTAGGAEKRRVCNELLDRIQDSMRSVIVSAPDYESLQMILTARRLYQKTEPLAKEKQDMNRRFVEGYKRLLLLVEGQPPQEWLELQDRIKDYEQELKELGIKDYQVAGLDREKYDMDGDTVLREIRLPFKIGQFLFHMVLSAIPILLLNLPVGVLANLYAERRRKIALAESKVKIRAMDVKLTEKILLCIILVPTLWFIYGLILVFFTDLDGPAIALVILSFPVFSYLGVVVTEAGVVNFKDLRPYIMRLFPSARRRLAALPAIRRQLQADLRAFIKKMRPILGDIYYEKDLNWKTIQEKNRLESGMTVDGKAEAKKEK